MSIPLSAPDIDDDDIAAVAAVLRTPRLSIGPKQEEFEQAVAGFTGVAHGVALSSGTAGLHLALIALGIGEGDEVIIPSFTFIAVAHAVRYLRAIPVFADIDPVTLNITAETVGRVITPRTRAIIAVHNFGCPADLDPILAMAASRDIRVIEDACEALGAEYYDRRAGSMGDCGIFAFYPNKPITTGEGGLLVTRHAWLAEAVRALRNQGRRPQDGWLDHALPGYNYRLSEINCALGCSQMKRIDNILAQRADRAAVYAERLRGIPELTLPVAETPAGRVCWFVYVIRLESGRDRVAEFLAARGIASGKYFAPLHLQPLYAPYAVNANLKVTEQAAPRTLALPFFNHISDDEIAEVAATLRAAIRAGERT